MDQLLLDVTDLPAVEVGEVAVLIGHQGQDAITVGELAGLAGTISYEIVTRFAARLPRITVDQVQPQAESGSQVVPSAVTHPAPFSGGVLEM
jgi:alanine racemase